MNSPLRFHFPLSAAFRGEEIEIDADITYVPPAKRGSRIVRDASVRVHDAALSDGNDDFAAPRPARSVLVGLAESAAAAAIDSIAAEASGRLGIERDLAASRAALSRSPLQPPRIAASRPLSRIEVALDALG